ncbi:MAG: hypothetical protein OXC95_06450 [Dehalococcoidia bacterium]|nr:hypothetical protein [Dehalococcoidia bacterium]
MVTQRVFVSGQSAERYGGPGAFVVVFPLDGKYAARRSVLTEESGGFVAMEVRGVTLALNSIPQGQEIEVRTLCDQLAGYVRRKGKRSWGDSHDVARELREALREAISRHKEVGAVTYRRTEGLPEPLRRARELAMEALGISQEDLDGMRAKRKKEIRPKVAQPA